MSAEGWTRERVAQLKTLWLQGLSASAIGKQLGGTTRNAVISKVHRLGLAGRVTPSRPIRQPKRKPPAVAAIARQDGPAIGREGGCPCVLHRQPVRRGAALRDGSAGLPVRLRDPPAKGANSVRFIDRTRRQCAMFCDGESGPDGFVCGEPAQGSWCKSCAQIVWQPRPKQRAAA